eukprot:TRINITY_DN364_c0_g1_i1.p1 TRINITY_DN364_c0_g1~~TRINITY_DN364_c0_g1_i1.p1  ORF type:complete len:206 (+),score=53.80 TRINITY_DN364_c0_g1_i1:155-772(+)
MGQSSTKSEPQAAPQPIKSTEEITDKILTTVDNLTAKLSQLEVKAAREALEGQRFLKAGEKKRAIGCMKRKRAYDKSILSLTEQIHNTEMLVAQIQQQDVILATAEATSLARDAMKSKAVDVEQLQEVTDDIKEQQKDLQEISELLAAGYNDVDNDDDILAELDNLSAESIAVPTETISASVVPASLPASEVLEITPPSTVPQAS